jgi:tight adherence protein B
MRGLGPEFIVLLVLVLGAVGAVVWFTALSPAAKNRRKMKERMKTLNKKQLAVGSEGETPEMRLRRDDSRTAMDKLARRLLPNPEVLKAKLDATGKNLTIGKYLGMCIVSGILAGGTYVLFTDFPEIAAPLIALGVGLFFPHWLVKRWVNKRQEDFVNNLPEALDMIVRGVKSGLPVAETISVVAEETEGVIAEEFQRVTEDSRIGMTLEAALWSSAERLNATEFKFFVVVLTVQRETGGNLAETLENLSELVRSRKQMKMKVRAMSSEARASMYILGGLPFAIGGLLLLISPDYILTLFRTDAGHMILGIGGVLLFLGWLVMAKMVNFEI